MIQIAVMGFGTVGAGVAEILQTNGALLEKRLGEAVALKYILDIRDFPDSPFGALVAHDFETIVNDPELDVVVETIGGAGVAYEYTRRALLAGKHVVTSNKELVATRGRELLTLAEEKNVNYLFEASVGGGIPILRPLQQCLAANEIEEVFGILNGTTNYILTRMVRSGITFEAALKEAQAMGYAEQDPTADVEGQDACRKICILADLAFGREVLPEQVPTEGISGVTLRDVEIVEKAGWRVKLLGRAVRRADGSICAYVAPHLVEEHHPIAAVEDVFNAVMVRGNAVGEVMFYGPGAGKLPTASAVVADVIDAAQHRQQRRRIGWEAGAAAACSGAAALSMRCYLRTKDDLGRVEALFPDCEILSSQEGEVAFLAPEMPLETLRQCAEALQVCAKLCVLE
ncbi:MAG: homoserine dehydrogenase [Clostridiales bacterium]|nr:homoserine dehydrogenase [Clostridiales bacterium]MDY4037018.1 homoserine dehydrogenase [Candidatus Pseudoscilispira sp.]